MTTIDTVGEALAYARDQADRPTEDWEGYCLRFVRSCFGIPPLFASAWGAWIGADPEDRHPGTDPNAAPVGAALVYRGGEFGHIMLAANPFPDGTPAAWSNDLDGPGRITKVNRRRPVTQWGQTYVGYLTAVNDVDLPTLRPRHTEPYPAIERAIVRLRDALQTARNNNDRRDARALRAEIGHLRDLHDTLRRPPNRKAPR